MICLDKGLYMFKLKSHLSTFFYYRVDTNQYKYCFFNVYTCGSIKGITNLYNIINYIIQFKMTNLLKKKIDTIEEDDEKEKIDNLREGKRDKNPLNILCKAVNLIEYKSGDACWKRKHKKIDI